MNSLQELKSLLLQERVLNFSNLNEGAIAEMLDNRDSEEFESDWLRVFQLIGQRQFTESASELISEIREEAYKKTFSSTQHSELASYVADDFELIAKSLLSEFNDEWLNALLLAYLQGQFPHTKLLPKKSGLELILETASIQQLAVR
jgi:hypothetical protein